MEKNKKPENNSPDPINFDSEQLKELEKLIDGLKKEIVFPGKRPVDKQAFFKANQN
jgi:hypothetical protein